MKNVVFIIVDSLNYTRLQQRKFQDTPFMLACENSEGSFSNVFSEAPYTEAALMAIMAGQDTLSNGGYLRCFRDVPQTLMECIQSHGIETFYNACNPNVYPSVMSRGVDWLYYNNVYEFNALWSYRLYYYADLYHKDELDNVDWQYLEELLKDNLEGWLRQVDEILNADKTTDLIRDNINQCEAEQARKMLQVELECYKKNPSGYLVKLLEQQKKHILFKVPKCMQNNKIKNRSLMKNIRKMWKPIFRKIRKKNILYNIKNNSFPIKNNLLNAFAIIKNPKRRTVKNFVKGIYISFNTIFDFDLNQRIEDNYDRFKNAPSARKQFDQFLNWLDERKDSRKSYFAFLHVDDVHNPEVFFTYDSENEKLLEKERNQAKALLEKIDNNYKGNITHDLSLQYIDGVLNDFVEKLKTKEGFENTTIIITADHGFSFSGFPVRNSFVNNFYLENYHVPVYIIDKKIPKQRNTSLFATKDIPTTILDIFGINKPKNFVGVSMLRSYGGRNYLTTEYCGGGCPDLRRRNYMQAVFDKKRFLAVYSKPNEKITKNDLASMYDLNKDQLQLHNLADKYYKFPWYKKFISLLENRHQVIISENKNNINTNKIIQYNKKDSIK